MTTVVAGKPLVTSLVVLASVSRSMVTIMTGLDYADHFTDFGFQAHAVGYRGITALGRNGTVTVIRPGDFDAASCLRWEGDDE